MKQTILSILLMLLPMVASADAVEIDGIWYNLVTKANVAEVTRNPSNGSGYYSGDITIPSSVTYGGIKYNVTSIAGGAFRDCERLTSVTIPITITSIGGLAFNLRNRSTISIHISDITAWCKIDIKGMLSDYDTFKLFVNGNEIKNLVIPNNVTSIGDYSFCRFSSLTSVIIPNSVTSIGNYAFCSCYDLSSVTIPSSVTSVGNGAFSSCTCLTSITIPKSVTSIGASAFSYCSELTSISIPNEITTIAQETFHYCTKLSTVTIPTNVTSIGRYAFEGCTSLTSVTIPNSVTSIGDNAFYDCSRLTSMTIPKNVTSIGNNAFFRCEKLTDVYCKPEQVRESQYSGTGLYTASNAFDRSYPEYITLHVPSASIESYKALEPWSKFKNIVALEGGDNTETPKCATPVISITNDKISFSCATESAEFISEVTVGDAKKYYDSEINLSKKYIVSVYATKTGYLNSDVATKEITISGGNNSGSTLQGDVNGDGKVDVADHVALSSIIMGSGTKPDGGGDNPTPVNPSGDDIETDKITASFTGGAYSKINGKIQSGSKLNVKFSNNSSKSVTLTKMQLNDAETGLEGNNLLTENVVVPAGQSASYTITVGLLGITKPVIVFTYQYSNKTYQVKDEWQEIEFPSIGF